MLASGTAHAGPSLTVSMGEEEGSERVASTIQIVFLLTLLSMAPALILMVTSFTRIIIVLGFLRQAMSTQQMPPNPVLIGLALFLTFFVMSPVWTQIHQEAVRPYLNGEITPGDALKNGVAPLRGFMASQTREKDMALFQGLSKREKPANLGEVPLEVLIPSFMISELRKAFQMGFVLYLPFLIIDMVVASVLMSMGMLMLPPVMISLPFKILLFVLADGWHLVVRSIVTSFF
ncbi:MAG: flagellar type III secretion system pore protein FliP [Candidatus Eisenbacteria bacterium]|uniref:Flagellar biosynthetic protein FliP n=1 Tax=Eiseniibacteriota bacterium TaxID=2212470 RepID=A0A948RZR1_UNCEI|nr:flagellar type III secretion system pore protein FliP [Candidatus Eisenbacteria bacterium]MBU1950955.1 flagellar type III secretion system pore protein FliP [Candidatus Eisenbacteria bacterium]MBU2692172.1 flagellar type III secretion system pore protein FliP [Candidatus Eisenbacteria bacterium]